MSDTQPKSTTPEQSDYDADVHFGHWLRKARTDAGLSLEEASLRSGITEQRMKSLEVGYAAKGITMPEAKLLAALYRVNSNDLIRRAAESESDSDE